jgi:scyllo-inositol 2-dehydrogenase (NADP+)
MTPGCDVSESSPLRLLVHLSGGRDLDYVATAAPLLRRLTAIGRFDVEEADGAIRPNGHHLVLAASERPLSDGEAAALLTHLRSGGGLVALGRTLAVWAQDPLLAEAAGWRPHAPPSGRDGPPPPARGGGLLPLAELRVRPVAGGPIAQRLDDEVLLRDRLPTGYEPPADAEVLATVPWRYGEQVAAFRRRVGDGRLVYLGLGCSAEVLAEPAFGQLVHRCLLAAAGLEAAPAVGVGLYGYGAIGREHARSVTVVEGFDLRAVCDQAPARRADAASRFHVRAYADAPEMLADPAVELVVVGVPPVAHASAVLESLEAGKHVVCEKPFALTTGEADRMLAASSRAQRALTVYQSRRWDPDYLALRAAVARGDIGHPFYAEAFIGGFGHPCSYWHSHQSISGGTIFDWGSHYLDWLLQLMEGEVVGVVASAHKRVWHDVTNADQVRVDLTFAGGEQATFLQSDVAAALKPKWYVLGTEGAIVGDWRPETVKTRAWTGDLVEERLQPAESPAVLRVYRPDGEGGTHVAVPSLPSRPAHAFYRNLADHLLLGEPLAVRPEEARRNVAVMEAATRSIAAGGRLQELRA